MLSWELGGDAFNLLFEKNLSFKKCESGVPPDGCTVFPRRFMRRMALSKLNGVGSSGESPGRFTHLLGLRPGDDEGPDVGWERTIVPTVRVNL